MSAIDEDRDVGSIDYTDGPDLWRALLALDDLIKGIFGGLAMIASPPTRRLGDWYARALGGLDQRDALTELSAPLPTGPDPRYGEARAQWAAANAALTAPGHTRVWYRRHTRAIGLILQGAGRGARVEYLDMQRTRLVPGWEGR